MTAILGISAYYHDSAAALIVDGKIIAAAQEERFTRKKHDESFPVNAVNYALNQAGLKVQDLDYVAFYEKPFLKFDRLLESYLAVVPLGFSSFVKAIPLWLKKKIFLKSDIHKQLGNNFKRRIIFVEHHESHAASAFFSSPFEEAAILTIDGVGEWATASIGTGQHHKIELTEELRFPHSLGMLYSAFTYYCGFKVNSGEYKLMGLAPYGQPKYVEKIKQHLVKICEDGSIRLDMNYFNYVAGLTMTSRKFHDLFGKAPRQPESPMTQLDMDLAASIQVVTEEIILKMGRYVFKTTGLKKLCLAGGVALNCVANGKLLREGPFEDIWIQPAAGDAGGALGAAQFVWHQLLNHPRKVTDDLTQQGSYLGPLYSDAEIKEFLDSRQAIYTHCLNEEETVQKTAALLAQEKVIGWFQGRMEFGPRALGNRSIIGDARSTKMQSVMNLKIKFRESFRPFAPSVLQNQAHNYFELSPEHKSPYMLLVADIIKDKQIHHPDSNHKTGLELLNQIRSDIPSVTHVDYSARIQTVEEKHNPMYFKLISKFAELTGCPVIINTSFNVRSEPIVCSPEDAYRCFLATDMDVLVLGNLILLKENQPATSKREIDEYLSKHQLD